MYAHKEDFRQASSKTIRPLANIIFFAAILCIILFSSSEYLWAQSLVILAGACVFLSYGIYVFKSKKIEFIDTPLNIFVLLFLAFSFFSLIGLAPFILKLISPSTFMVYHNNLSYPNNFFMPIRPISLYGHNSLVSLALALSFFAIFFFLVNNFDSWDLRIKIVKIIIFCACLVAVLGIANMLFQNKKLFWVMDIASGTPSGPFTNTIHFASFLAFSIPLALGLFAANIDFKINSYAFGRAKMLIYKIFIFLRNCAIYLGPALVMMFALFKSLSRGAVLAFLFSLFVFILALSFKPQTRQRGLLALFFMVLFILVIFALDSSAIRGKILNFSGSISQETIFKQDITERLSTLKNMFITDSAITRFSVWKDTLRLFFDFPVFGTGLGTFNAIFPKYKTISGSGKMVFSHAENDYLEILAESGLFGFVLLFIMSVIFLKSAFMNLKSTQSPFQSSIICGVLASIFALLFCALTDFPFHIPSISFIFMLVCFIGWPKRKNERVFTFSYKTSRKVFLSIIWAISLVSLFLFIIALKLMLGELFLDKSNKIQGNFPKSLGYLKKAIFFNGDNAEYRYQLGKLYFLEAKVLKEKGMPKTLELISASRINFSKAIELEPTNWRYHFYKGSSELVLLNENLAGSHLKDAEKSFARAIELNPTEYMLYGYLANYYLAFDPQKAFQLYRKMLALRKYEVAGVLETIFKVSTDADFLRQAIPDDPYLVLKYANFLYCRGINADKYYLEVLGLLRKVDFETRLSIAEEFKAVKKYKEAVQCLLSAAKMLKITSDTSGILEGALLSYQRGYYAEAYEEIKNTLSQLARKK